MGTGLGPPVACGCGGGRESSDARGDWGVCPALREEGRGRAGFPERPRCLPRAPVLPVGQTQGGRPDPLPHLSGRPVSVFQGLE